MIRRVLPPAFLLAGLLFLVAFGVALAHANLVRSEPAAGASLSSSPAKVQLWFTEALEPSFSEVVVYDASHRRVDQGDSHVAPGDPQSLVVSLKPSLSKGTYAIAWKTQSKVDGHVVRGIVPFGVGVAAPTAGAEAPVGVSEGEVSGSPIEMALRWLSLLGVAGLVGAAVFWLLVPRPGASFASRSPVAAGPHLGDPLGPPSPTGTGLTPVPSPTLLERGTNATHRFPSPATRPLGRERPGEAALLAGALFLVASLLLLLYQAAVSADTTLVGALGAPLLALATATQYGRLWTARMLLGIGLILVYLRRGRGGLSTAMSDRLALGTGALLLLTISLSSHSAAIGSFSPLTITNDWLHLAATAVWVGGLLQIAVLIPSLRRGYPEQALAATLGPVITRFGRVAAVALAVLGVTGLISAYVHVGTLDNLIGTGYGQALLVKVLLILPLVALAAVNHFLFRPVFARVRGAPSPALVAQIRDLTGAVGLTVRMELLFVVGVIAAVGVMTSLSPARQFGAATAGPLTLTAPAGDLTAAFTISPGTPGPNRYVVDVRDRSGQAAAAQRVILRLTYLDQDLGTSEVDLAPTAPGRFEGQSSDLAVAGRWEADAIVRRAGQDDVTARYGFDVTPTGAQSLGNVPLQVSVQFYLGLVLAVIGILALLRGGQLRREDLRRAAAIAVCGVGLMGAGAYVAFQDVQTAQAQVTAATQALNHPPTAQSIANGALVYRQNCAMCHGLDARGDGPMAPSLNPRPADLIVHVPLHTDADLENWIANGFPGSAMPAFKDKLSEDQRWEVLNYLKSLVSKSGGAP